jgi:hypothetical protein
MKIKSPWNIMIIVEAIDEERVESTSSMVLKHHKQKPLLKFIIQSEPRLKWHIYP